jgi:uncharacterized phage infection (PIP) family protein YhgE
MTKHFYAQRVARRVSLWAALAMGVLVTGCGGDSSPAPTATATATTAAKATATAVSNAKPSYCAGLSDLESSVKALANTNVRKNGTDALKANISQVQTQATAVVSQAKSDFADETSAVKTSLDTLSASVKQLAANPTASQLALLPAQLSSVSTAITNLGNAASTRCT